MKMLLWTPADKRLKVGSVLCSSGDIDCLLIRILTKSNDFFFVLWVVVGARNRTYPIPIPCSESIPEPIPMLESIPTPESIPDPIPELVQELILELVLAPIPDSTPGSDPESIPGSASAPESETPPELESTWESQFAPVTESGLTSEMELAREWE